MQPIRPRGSFNHPGPFITLFFNFQRTVLGVYFIVAIILILAVLACRFCCYHNSDYLIIANNNASDQTQPHYCAGIYPNTNLVECGPHYYQSAASEYQEVLTPQSSFYHSIYGIDYQYYNEQNHNIVEKYKLYAEK